MPNKIQTLAQASAIATQAPDFSNLPEELQAAAITQGVLLPTYMHQGLEALLDSFDVIQNNGRTPLYTWEFIDMIKKAEDAYNPDKIANLTARIPIIEDYEIDTGISRSELIKIYRSYQAMILGLNSLDEALKGDFMVFFIQKVMRELIVQKIALKGVWKGIRTGNQADRGADKSFTGLLKRLIDGCATGGDIPTANIFDSTDALDATHSYNEINEVCQLAYNDPDLVGIPLNVYLSDQAYTNYSKNRQTLNSTTVAPGTIVTSPDFMPNLTFKPQWGLAGSEKVVVTPKSNLVFSVNENPEHFNFELVKVIKGFQMNVLASGGIDYGYGKYLFLNDK